MSQNRVNNTATLGEAIGKYNLKVGQWIKFSIDEKTQNGLSEEQKSIYQKDRIFLVLTREDEMFDSCRCYLLDEEGKKYDYCPRMHELHFIALIWDHEIIAYSNDEVETFYEREKLLSIYEAAKKCLCEMNEDRAKILNVEIEIQQIKNKIIAIPFTKGATVGALSGKLPFELSTYVGTFLGHREGGLLAQTCKLASQIANEEKDNTMESIKRKF